MKTITTNCFGIVVVLGEPDADGDVAGSIISDLHEEPTDEFDTDYVIYNSMMDALESMILAHACAGVDITDPAYLCGVETAVESCANNS